MKQNTYNNRQYTIISMIILLGFVYVLRLFYIQIVDESYKLSAENNVLRYITQYPARGLIYDRNGTLMVYNEAVYDLMVIPKQVSALDTNELCRLIDMSKEEFKQKLIEARDYSSRKPTIFAKQLSKETFGYLQEKMYKFPGFYEQARTVRKYSKPIAAQALGYVGEVNKEITEKNLYYVSGDYIGISGIEEFYEPELRGTKGKKIMLVDVFNRTKGNYHDGEYDTLAVSGKDLYTTLDASLQEYGEKLMMNKRGSVVAIEPSSGEILALVSSPTYDPNLLVGRIRTKNFAELSKDKLKPLFNRALLAKYPPGSTFKLVNALIAMQEGLISEKTSFSCPGAYVFGGVTVGCHGHKSPLNLKESVQHSCNTYYCRTFRTIIDQPKFSTISEGLENWRNYCVSFGFGRRFENDLTSEANGLIPMPSYYDKYYGKNRWKSITIISLAIGQGEVLSTPLQLANLACIMANKGYYHIPHIAKAIGSKNNRITKYEKKYYTKVSQEHFDLIRDGMELAVEAGTATQAKIDSISVCGKTGTAQNPHGENHSIFICFAPKDNPKIAVACVVENSGYGGTWAAPIASLIIEKYLKGDINRNNPYRVFLEKRILEANFLEMLKAKKSHVVD